MSVNQHIRKYLVKQINEGVIVVNPIYSKLTQTIKKTREKISRRKARLFLLNEQNVNSALETAPQYLKKKQNKSARSTN